MKVLKYLILLINLMVRLNVSAQDISPFLKDFSATVYENEVYLEWTTRIGFSCEDVVVEHGLDTQLFLPIYTWPGICGNSSSEERYLYHIQYLNAGKHYFRLDLGLSGKSHVITVNITPTSSSALVVPNPMKSGGKIYWNNHNRDPFTLQIFQSDGNLIYEEISFENMIDLNAVNLISGSYYYSLASESTRFMGKFLVY